MNSDKSRKEEMDGETFSQGLEKLEVKKLTES